MARFFHIESGSFTVAGNPTAQQVQKESKTALHGAFGFLRVLWTVISDLRKK